MKILFLYNNENALPLAKWLKKAGNDVVLCTKKLSEADLPLPDYDLAISYSYRYILPEKVINAFDGNIINMHISYLPWNRGENPNQWSFLENTPQGVTIHYMSAGLDKGDIIAQRLLHMDPQKETLSSSYQKLNQVIQDLFKEIYPYYHDWPGMKKCAKGKGNYHSTADFKKYLELIDSWDMPVSQFLEKAQAMERAK